MTSSVDANCGRRIDEECEIECFIETRNRIEDVVGICRLGIPMGIISSTTPARDSCSLGVRVVRF